MESIGNKKIKEVDVDKAEALIKDEGYKILDVREPSELMENGFIETALNIPKGALESSPPPSSTLDPNQKWVIVCRSGIRSASSCETLEAAGFENVVNMIGGMIAWEGASKPIQKK